MSPRTTTLSGRFCRPAGRRCHSSGERECNSGEAGSESTESHDVSLPLNGQVLTIVAHGLGGAGRLTAQLCKSNAWSACAGWLELAFVVIRCCARVRWPRMRRRHRPQHAGPDHPQAAERHRDLGARHGARRGVAAFRAARRATVRIQVRLAVSGKSPPFARQPTRDTRQSVGDGHSTPVAVARVVPAELRSVIVTVTVPGFAHASCYDTFVDAPAAIVAIDCVELVGLVRRSALVGVKLMTTVEPLAVDPPRCWSPWPLRERLAAANGRRHAAQGDRHARWRSARRCEAARVGEAARDAGGVLGADAPELLGGGNNPLTVVCDTVEVRVRTSGALKVLLSSIWIS